MDDVKKTYREGEQTTKEAWRQADGDESLADKVGNAGDEIRKDLGNAGDDVNGARRAESAPRKPLARPMATIAWPTRSATRVTTCGATWASTASHPSSTRRGPRSAGASSRPRLSRGCEAALAAWTRHRSAFGRTL